MIGQTLAHDRITAAIGAGGMGEVYRATDTNDFVTIDVDTSGLHVLLGVAIRVDR